MRPMYFLLSSLFVVLLGSACFHAVDSSDSTDSSCNCDHCDEKRVTSIEMNEADNETVEETEAMNVEDADGDGNRTICARDRDSEDRSFSSVCRMLCHNNCTRYRIWIYVENNVKKYTAFAFRTNYYKLHDGPC